MGFCFSFTCKKKNRGKIEVDTKKKNVADAIKLLNPDNIVDINISNIPLENIISEIYKKEDTK